MKTRIVLASFVLLALSSLAFHSTPAQTPAKQGQTNDALVARGKYLVDFGGCHDCHSPKIMTDKGPVPDLNRMLSGHPADSKLPAFEKDIVTTRGWVLFTGDLTGYVGPWGVSYAYNLTPEPNTGIGLWTEEIFMKAVRTGKHMGAGRPILPPMPWMNVAGLTDEDLSAVYAYLKSIPPVKNAIPGAMSLDEYLGANK